MERKWDMGRTPLPVAPLVQIGNGASVDPLQITVIGIVDNGDEFQASIYYALRDGVRHAIKVPTFELARSNYARALEEINQHRGRFNLEVISPTAPYRLPIPLSPHSTNRAFFP